MSRIMIDAGLSATLRSLAHPVELCDASGQVLGDYVPRQADPFYSQPQITDEELRRRKARGSEGRPLADILADLEKLAT